MDEELDSEDPAIEQLQKYIDNLEPDIYEIRVSVEGALLSSSRKSEDDKTLCPFYPTLEAIQHPAASGAVSRADLEELDRLGPSVDLVKPILSINTTDKLVFKYYFIEQRMAYIWHEMNLWMRLPRHPNIIPFDRVVMDELEGRCVGFTVKYISGGTLEENRSRVFKLKWLHQLLTVIDELNLNLGIAHQDVAPRNLVVDAATDSLMIFDFNFSARIGEIDYDATRSDVNGAVFTLYELITGDDEPRSVPHEQQNVAAIESKEWIKHPDVGIDAPVSQFREVLRKWTETPCSGPQITTYTDAPNFIDWPDMPQPAPIEIVVGFLDGIPVRKPQVLLSQERKDLRKEGKTILNWQRPPQTKLKPGTRLLETGEFLNEA